MPLQDPEGNTCQTVTGGKKIWDLSIEIALYLGNARYKIEDRLGTFTMDH